MRKFGAILLFILAFAFFCHDSASATSELPRLDIYLENISLSELEQSPKTLKYADNSAKLTTALEQNEFDGVEIKTRGNSTLTEPKKPFQLKFDHDVDLLGLGASKKWVLLANSFDDTHLRNELANSISQTINQPFANRGEYLELYIDNQYRGLYYLTHKVEISPQLIDIDNEYAILVELDNIHYDEEDEAFFAKSGDRIVIKDSVKSKNEPAAIESFMRAYDMLQDDLEAGDWQAVQQDIDVESFAQFFVMYEISSDPDGLATSFSLYQNGLDAPIHASETSWDYDFAFNSTRWTLAEYDPLVSWSKQNLRDDVTQTTIFAYLMDFPEFREIVGRIFREQIAPNIDTILERLDTTATRIQTPVQLNNYFWQRYDATQETLKLRNWLELRLRFLVQFYANDAQLPTGFYVYDNYDSEFLVQQLPNQLYRILRASDLAALTANPEDQTVFFAQYEASHDQFWAITAKSAGEYRIFSAATGLELQLSSKAFSLTPYQSDISIALSSKAQPEQIAPNTTFYLKSNSRFFKAATDTRAEVAAQTIFATKLQLHENQLLQTSNNKNYKLSLIPRDNQSYLLFDNDSLAFLSTDPKNSSKPSAWTVQPEPYPQINTWFALR